MTYSNTATNDVTEVVIIETILFRLLLNMAEIFPLKSQDMKRE
jgi:hypothetical protein